MLIDYRYEFRCGIQAAYVWTPTTTWPNSSTPWSPASAILSTAWTARVSPRVWVRFFYWCFLKMYPVYNSSQQETLLPPSMTIYSYQGVEKEHSVLAVKN